MTGFVGKNLYLKFGSTVLNTDFRAFSESEEMGIIDESAGADVGRSYLTTLYDGTGTGQIVIQSADTTTWGALARGTEGTLEWGEEGTAAGKARHYVNAIVTSRAKTMDYADLVVGNIAWQFNGAITDTTY